MPVSIKVRKSEGLDEFISGLPRNVRGIASESVADYVIGNKQHGLKHEPNYTFVTRTRAYGQPFQKDKQRRWFFWAKDKGIIKPGQENRTHAVSEGWRKEGEKTNVRIVNEAEGVDWVMGKKQAAQPRLAGWHNFMIVIDSNMKGAIRQAYADVRAYITSRKGG